MNRHLRRRALKLTRRAAKAQGVPVPPTLLDVAKAKPDIDMTDSQMVRAAVAANYDLKSVKDIRVVYAGLVCGFVVVPTIEAQLSPEQLAQWDEACATAIRLERENKLVETIAALRAEHGV